MNLVLVTECYNTVPKVKYVNEKSKRQKVRKFAITKFRLSKYITKQGEKTN